MSCWVGRQRCPPVRFSGHFSCTLDRLDGQPGPRVPSPLLLLAMPSVRVPCGSASSVCSAVPPCSGGASSTRTPPSTVVGFRSGASSARSPSVKLSRGAVVVPYVPLVVPPSGPILRSHPASPSAQGSNTSDLALVAPLAALVSSRRRCLQWGYQVRRLRLSTLLVRARQQNRGFGGLSIGIRSRQEAHARGCQRFP